MNDIVINLWDLILYIVIAITIQNMLPEDYTEGLGAIAGGLWQIGWFVVWLVVFVIIDYNLNITLQ